MADETSNSNMGLLVVSSFLAVGAIGMGWYIGTDRAGGDPVEQINPAAVLPEGGDTLPQVVPEDATEAEASEDVALAEQAEEAPVPQPELPTPPSVDEVRVEPDGLTIVAGRALPGSSVTILLDGIEDASVSVDASGAFAAVTMLTPSPEPRVLSLVQQSEAGRVESAEEIILAPIAVAESAAEPDAATAADVAQGDTVEEAGADAIAGAQPDVTTTDVAAMDVPATTLPEDLPTRPSTRDETVAATAPNAVALSQTGEQLALADPETARTPLPQDRDVPDTTEAAPTLPNAPTSATPNEDVAAEEPDLPATETAPAFEGAATGPVAVLRSTVTGIEVLAQGPQVLDNVAIDTISYSLEGAVQLQGRAQSDARSVRVYLDNQAIATLQVDPDGRWRGELPDVDTGVYQLRIDELSTSGAVTSRIETPFKREDPEVLEAARGDDPGKAKQITVQTGNTLWAIARDRYGEGLLYVQIVEANKEAIRDPDMIFPGQVFDLPE